jgi:hypothetical protein
MRRDTYNDYVTHEQITEYRSGASATFFLKLVRDNLLRRSGARNVKSAVMYGWRDPCVMVDRLSVHFDSRAWTGLS